MRRLAILLVLLATLAGCSLGTAKPGPPVPPPTPTATAAALVGMPDLVGQNAAVAVDRLHKLGLKNVDLGTVDGHEFVVLPQNWTVRTQSAQPGDRIAADTKVVLGCSRNG
jgi:PASTA domain